jgi:hypothetical protein
MQQHLLYEVCALTLVMLAYLILGTPDVGNLLLLEITNQGDERVREIKARYELSLQQHLHAVQILGVLCAPYS